MKIITVSSARGLVTIAVALAALACTATPVATQAPAVVSPSTAPIGSPSPSSPPPTIAASPSAATTALPTVSASPAPAVADIQALIEQMDQAVNAGNADAYLALVDRSDPVFSVEHTRFAEDWAANPPDEYSLSIDEVMVEGDEAVGVLSTTWAAGGQDVRTAVLDVRFTQQTDGAWRYAGEYWTTQEVDHFRVHVAPGLEPEVDAITEALPDVFDHVTQSLGYEPAGTMEIKLFNGPAELVSTVRLGLPDIHGWNEPGEALKLRLDPEVPSLTPAIAHEFTHFVGFDRAGGQRTLMPWWLDEGIASFLGYHFEGPELGEFQIGRVREWADNGELADWQDMAVFETTPQEIWRNAYAQGYAFAVFVSQTFSQERRNDWLAAMATEMEIEEATATHLGVTFDELDASFREWLDEQG